MTPRAPAASPAASPAADRAAKVVAPVPCGVVVLAKAPVPGRVKTRLIPALGAAGAAALARRMLAHALAQALAAGVGPVALAVAGGARDAFVRALARDAGVPLWPQGGGGLGTRMARALARMHAHAGGAALLIGTDAPALDAAVLRRAAAALAGHDAVAAPTVDGGYALIGTRAPPGAPGGAHAPAGAPGGPHAHPAAPSGPHGPVAGPSDAHGPTVGPSDPHGPTAALFHGMRWSHPQVMAETRVRAAAAGLRLAELAPPLHDLDTPEDLAQLPPAWRDCVAGRAAR